MTMVTYIGHCEVLYPHYKDRISGATLRVVPGGVYDVVPVSGNVLSEGTEYPMDGKFIIYLPEREEKPETGHGGMPGIEE